MSDQKPDGSAEESKELNIPENDLNEQGNENQTTEETGDKQDEANLNLHVELPDIEQNRKLFIGGLARDTTDESFKNFYGKWGEITDSIVMKDGQTGKSRGFGFVTYASVRSLDAAMAERPHVVDGKTVEPKRAMPRDMIGNSGAEGKTTKKLYVSGVRECHNEDMFREYFSQFGEIETTEIVTDKETNKPRGFGFITFVDHDSVDKCVLIKSHHIANYRCDVKKAVPREDMRGGGGRRDSGGFGNRSGGGGMGRRGGGRGGNWGNNQGGWGSQGGNWGNQGAWGGGHGGGWGQQGGWGPQGWQQGGGGQWGNQGWSQQSQGGAWQQGNQWGGQQSGWGGQHGGYSFDLQP